MTQLSGFNASAPGGGGGGSASNGSLGGAGAPGKVELIYTPNMAPNNNVIRFILFVPSHGGNDGKVLIRALTSGTVAKLDVQYGVGGKLRLLGYNSGGTN